MAVLSLRGELLMSAGRPADIRAILFDKDGTMSRSEPQLLVLAKKRIRHCLSLAGDAVSEQLEILLEKAYGLHPSGLSLDPAGITAVAARDHNLLSTAAALTMVGHGWPESLMLAHETFRLADLDIPPGNQEPDTTDGLLDLLDVLHSNAVHCAVISNDEPLGIQKFLARHSLSHQIGVIWSAQHEPRKPDPQAIHQLCKLLGVPPFKCALIGDANTDLRMARDAGVGVVLGYRGGWSQRVQLEEGYPLLDHWGELTVGAGHSKPDGGVSMAT